MIHGILNSQTLTLRYDGIISDSVRFLTIDFSFDSSWTDKVKTVIFSHKGQTYNVALAQGSSMYLGNNTCYVPQEVIKSPGFTVSVYGVKNSTVITSSQETVSVEESGVADSIPADPTPSVWTQMLQISENAKTIATSVRTDADNGEFDGEGVIEGGTENQVLAKNSGDDFDTKWVTPIDAYSKTQSDTKYVAKTTTVNGKALSGNISLTSSDVGAYPNPQNGIPKTHLASDVQTSLGKADTALQVHQDISGKENISNKVKSILPSSTDTQYPSAKCVYDKTKEIDHTVSKINRKITDYSNGWQKQLPDNARSRVTIDKIGGFSYVNNQLYNKDSVADTFPQTNNGITFRKNTDGSILASGTLTSGSSNSRGTLARGTTFYPNHIYYLKGCPSGGGSSTYRMRFRWNWSYYDNGEGLIIKAPSSIDTSDMFVEIFIYEATENFNKTFYPNVIDLTLAFGSGNEPLTVDDPRLSLVSGFLPYDAGTLKEYKVTSIRSVDSLLMNLVEEYTLPTNLMTFLSDKGYGQSHGDDYNYIDFKTKKYYKKGKYIDDAWIAGVEEFDIGLYIDQVPTLALDSYYGTTIRFMFESGTSYNIPNEITYEVNSDLYVNSSTKTVANSYTHEYIGEVNPATCKWNDFANKYKKYMVIPISQGDTKYTIKGKNGVCYFYFVKDFKIPRLNESLMMSDHLQGFMSVGAGETLTGYIPSDAKYVIIQSLALAVETLDSLAFENNIYGILESQSGELKRLIFGSHNIRDFNTEGGIGAGCPDNLVSTNLPLWKEHFSKWLNCDFLALQEWFPYFDKSHTIDSYNTLLKQFYPYKYELGSGGEYNDRILLSKHKGFFVNIGAGNSNPALIFRICGKSIAVVAWEQSNAIPSQERKANCQKAINYLNQFDIVIIGGDTNIANVSDFEDEIKVWTDAGYVVGNGGYWGKIPTCTVGQATEEGAIDNIMSKGLIYENFEVKSDKITSDHNAVRATLSFETEYQ